MHPIELTSAHADERGVIQDLLTDQVDAITRITFEPLAIRGNHVHRETTQWTFVLKGSIKVVTQEDANMRSKIFKSNELFVSYPNEPHAMQALEYSEILVFTRGPRSGASYQSDTFRVNLIQ